MTRNEDPPPKKPNLELVKQEIPFIRNIDLSFWENPKFLRWQLMRLNKNYKKEVDKVWWEFWTEAKYKNYPKDLKKTIKKIYEGFPPMLQEPLEKWKKKDSKYYSLGGLKLILKYFRIFDNFKPLLHETFDEWHERLAHTELDPIRFHSMLETQFIDKKGGSMVAFWKLDMLNLPPIPWCVRFPFPPFLDRIPPWPNKKKKGAGRPQGSFKDSGKNLLIYELSQGGMQDMEIARLLFGIKKSTEKWPDKHSTLSWIFNIKRAVEKVVLQVYPF